MIREGNKVFFTEEDRQNLIIKQFSDQEIRKNKREYEKNNRKRIFLPISILMFSVVVFVFSENLEFFAYIGMILATAWIILSETVYIWNRNIVSDGHYIELVVESIRDPETHIGHSATTGSYTDVFYSIVGVDTTSGYKCVYYLHKNEIKNVKCGDTIRTIVERSKL